MTQRMGIDKKTPLLSSDRRVVIFNIFCTFIFAEGTMVIEVFTSSRGEDHGERAPGRSRLECSARTLRRKDTTIVAMPRSYALTVD